MGRVQATITRPAHRDEMTVRAELLQEEADREALVEALRRAIQDLCRVRADAIELVPAGSIAEDAPTMVDERAWA